MRKIQIYDNIGHLVYSENCDSKEIAVNTSIFASGIYVIAIETESDIRHMKFIKK